MQGRSQVLSFPTSSIAYRKTLAAAAACGLEGSYDIIGKLDGSRKLELHQILKQSSCCGLVDRTTMFIPRRQSLGVSHWYSLNGRSQSLMWRPRSSPPQLHDTLPKSRMSLLGRWNSSLAETNLARRRVLSAVAIDFLTRPSTNLICCIRGALQVSLWY